MVKREIRFCLSSWALKDLANIERYKNFKDFVDFSIKFNFSIHEVSTISIHIFNFYRKLVLNYFLYFHNCKCMSNYNIYCPKGKEAAFHFPGKSRGREGTGVDKGGGIDFALHALRSFIQGCIFYIYI